MRNTYSGVIIPNVEERNADGEAANKKAADEHWKFRAQLGVNFLRCWFVNDGASAKFVSSM